MPLFLVGVFDSEELHVPNRGHMKGVSICRLGCRLGSGLAALLVEGLARIWKLGEQAWQGAWQGAPAPVASSLPREHCMKYNFLSAKTFGSTPCALFAHTISVSYFTMYHIVVSVLFPSLATVFSPRGTVSITFLTSL